MSIPDFQSVMLPLLIHFSDGKEHSNQETLKSLAEHFQLTDEELGATPPERASGGLYESNRMGQESPQGGRPNRISAPRLLRNSPTRFGGFKSESIPHRSSVLNQFPEYLEFRTPKNEVGEPKSESVPQSVPETDKLTPEDHLEYGYQRIREQLATDLLAKVKDSSPAFFEKLVVELLLAMGYGGSRQDAGRTVGRAGDGGIDGVINEDRLGLDVIYIQAKRWEGTVGRPEIQKFAGALQGQRAKKGIFITTSDFTKDANDHAAMIDSRIVLINGVRRDLTASPSQFFQPSSLMCEQ